MERNRFVTEGQCFPTKLLSLVFLILTAFNANHVAAAQLRINPADGPGNSVILNGDFTFSVLQSNGNIDIAVSGVKLVFDCDTATDPQTCVVAVDSTTTTEATTVTSATTTTTTTSSDPSTQDCKGFGSNQQCSGDTTTTTTDTTTSGDPAATEEEEEEEECNSMACLLIADTSSEETQEASDFATGDRVFTFGEDFGSAGANSTGNTFPLELSESRVRVGDLSMRGGVHRGAIGFVPTSKEPLNADLRLWISTERDGAPVSDECAYAGGFDGALDISVGTAGRCELKPSSTYYLNVAACLTTQDDYNCTKGAKNATRIGSIYLSAKYYD